MQKTFDIFLKDLSNSKNYLSNTLIYLIYFVSLFFLFIPSISKKFKTKIFFNTNKNNRKNAKRIALKILRKNNGQLYDRISSALYLFLKYKLNLASKNLDQDQIKLLLEEKIESSLIDDLIEIIVKCDEVKFSDRLQTDDSFILKKTILIIEKLDSKLK